MTRAETRNSLILAAIFSLRLLGLFMIYPVFETYARGLSGATPAGIGFALGIYGLTQGILQIPFGLLSDRLGRKPMIALGLLLFAAGSALCAIATSMDGMILGRALQGGGAVGAVVLALVADLTVEEHRTSAMAIVGVTIGLSFVVALVAGPLAAGWIGVTGIFWLMAGLSFAAIALSQWGLPTPPSFRFHRDSEAVPAMLGRVLANAELLRLNFGVLALHAMLTSSFLVVPGLLAHVVSVSPRDQWQVYLPVLLISVVVMVPAIIAGEKYRRMKTVFVATTATLAASQLLLLAAPGSQAAVLVAITAFFAGFNILEASLPSLVTKAAPPDIKGTATGLFSSGQFIGIFIGGALGGWAQQQGGSHAVFLMTSATGLTWLVVAATMARPNYLTTRLLRLGNVPDAASLATRLRELPGVAEAVVVAEEGLAYLKVDRAIFNADAAEALAGRA